MIILAYFLGAALLTNSVPHLIHGLSGYDFHSPFANPPGRGLSRPHVNVLWGGANFLGGCALLFGVGDFAFGANVATAVVTATALVVGVILGRTIERIRREAGLDAPGTT